MEIINELIRELKEIGGSPFAIATIIIWFIFMYFVSKWADAVFGE